MDKATEYFEHLANQSIVTIEQANADYDVFGRPDFEDHNKLYRKYLGQNLKRARGVVGVIGVGKIGTEISKSLMLEGFSVVGIDCRREDIRMRSIIQGSKTNYVHLLANFTNEEELRLALEFGLKTLNRKKYLGTIDTYCYNADEAKTIVRAIRKISRYHIHISSVLTKQNPVGASEYIISEKSPFIEPDSLENGEYAMFKRQADIEMKKSCSENNIESLIVYFNHILGGNAIHEDNIIKVFDGYNLGITPPDFRTLGEKRVKNLHGLRLPNNGKNIYHITETSTTSHAIVISLKKQIIGDLIIGHPIGISAKEYYKYAIDAHLGYGIQCFTVAELSENIPLLNLILNREFLEDEEIGNFEGPESMKRSWLLDTTKMQKLLNIQQNLYLLRLCFAFALSSKIPSNHNKQIILNMNK
jgi:hypothetical protein